MVNILCLGMLLLLLLLLTSLSREERWAMVSVFVIFFDFSTSSLFSHYVSIYSLQHLLCCAVGLPSSPTFLKSIAFSHHNLGHFLFPPVSGHLLSLPVILFPFCPHDRLNLTHSLPNVVSKTSLTPTEILL